MTVCSAKGVNWPGCKQVGRIQRLRCLVGKDEVTLETVYAVTSLTAEEASAGALLALNRGHWSIENQLHYVRDVTMREDASQVGADHVGVVLGLHRLCLCRRRFPFSLVAPILLAPCGGRAVPRRAGAVKGPSAVFLIEPCAPQRPLSSVTGAVKDELGQAQSTLADQRAIPTHSGGHHGDQQRNASG